MTTDDTDDQLSLLEFASTVYAMRGWQMPDLHVRAYHFLDTTEGERARVMQIFRGSGKSTILGIFLAWKLYRDPLRQILVLAADDALSGDMSRDVLALAENHPLLAGSVRQVPAVHGWWLEQAYAANARVPSVKAKGVMSRLTGSRADLAVLDDIEVPKNSETDEARRKLRKRVSELTHVLKPNSSKIWLGTPHTHASLYPEQIAAGAASLTVKLFAHARRFEDARTTRYLHGVPEGVTDMHAFVGVGPHGALLEEGRDYSIDGEYIQLREPPGAVLDLYAGCAWPERFTRSELAKRRRECRTLNEWDSQYQLQAKPLDSMRLDPTLMIPYSDEAVIRHANSATAMMLGTAQIVSATLRLDPSSGKPKSDVSALCLVLADAKGRLYWHRAIGLLGELATMTDDGAIRGGQVEAICDVIEQFQLPRIEVETNGVGTHVPAILRGALRRRGLNAGVSEKASTQNKQRRILAGLEPPLRSGYLHAHTSVLATVTEQMRDWNAAATDQADDFIDCAAGAILAEPVRIGQTVAPPREKVKEFGLWRPSSTVHTVEVEDRISDMLAGRDDDAEPELPRHFHI